MTTKSEIQQALHVDNEKTLKNVNARIKSKSTVPKQSATIQPWLLDQIIHIQHLSMHLRRTRHENTNSITTFEFGKLKRNLTYAGKRSIAAPPSKSTTITFYVYQAKKSHLEKRCDILIECSKRMTHTHVGNFNSRLWKYICVPISH